MDSSGTEAERLRLQPLLPLLRVQIATSTEGDAREYGLFKATRKGATSLVLARGITSYTPSGLRHFQQGI